MGPPSQDITLVIEGGKTTAGPELIEKKKNILIFVLVSPASKETTLRGTGSPQRRLRIIDDLTI